MRVGVFCWGWGVLGVLGGTSGAMAVSREKNKDPPKQG